jgi:hypothetical protein
MAALVRSFSLAEMNSVLMQLAAANVGRAVPYTHVLLTSTYGVNQTNWYLDSMGNQFVFVGSDAALRAAVPGIYIW